MFCSSAKQHYLFDCKVTSDPPRLECCCEWLAPRGTFRTEVLLQAQGSLQVCTWPFSDTYPWPHASSGPQQALPESLTVQDRPRNQHLAVHNSQALPKAKLVIFLKRPFSLKNRVFLKPYFVETSWPIYEKLGWPHIDVFNFKRPCGLLSDSCK